MDYQSQGDELPPEMENRAPIEARSPLSASLVGTDDKGGDKAKATTAQAGPQLRTIRKDDAWQPIGCPVIVAEFWPWQTTVRVTRPPWGMGRLDKDFLGSGRRSAERYLEALTAEFDERAGASAHFRANRKAHNRAFREIGRLLERREKDIRG